MYFKSRSRLLSLSADLNTAIEKLIRSEEFFIRIRLDQEELDETYEFYLEVCGTNFLVSRLEFFSGCPDPICPVPKNFRDSSDCPAGRDK